MDQRRLARHIMAQRGSVWKRSLGSAFRSRRRYLQFLGRARSIFSPDSARASLGLCDWRFRAIPLYWLDSRGRLFPVLTIRLARIGKKKQPFYRIIVTEKTRPRNGRFVEIVGTYNPRTKPHAVVINQDRIQYWLGKGAQPSDTVRSFLRNQKPA
jgi:small subunit ribosomal protein S16